MAGVMIGALGHPGRGLVDQQGRVTAQGCRWSIDWRVHSGNRWHAPGREPGARQALIGGAPIVETAGRASGGEVASIAYGVPRGGGVVEIHNRTPAPIAVALVISARTVDDRGHVGSIAWDGERVVLVDGRPALLLPRTPSHTRARAGAARGPADDVLELLEPDGPPWSSVHSEEGLAEAAFVFPLPHAATLRVVVPLAGNGAELLRRPPLPGSVDAVARGWDRIVAGGLSVELPTARLNAAVEVCRRRLLLALDARTDAWSAAIAARWGLASQPDPDVISMRCAPVEGSGLDVRRTLEQVAAELHVDPASALRGLDAVLDAATSTWTWPSGEPDDARVAAAVLDVVRDLVIRDGDGGLALCPYWPPSWGRDGMEVHRAPTAAGMLSFAVRWHAERPAVLWEIDGPGARLTAPGLDPTWSATTARGEALLAAAP